MIVYNSNRISYFININEVANPIRIVYYHNLKLF